MLDQRLHSTPVLVGRGIGRVFGTGELTTRVLHPSDVEIRGGEVVVIVGPSGSGKTTMLSILGLVLRPSEGEVWLGDTRVSELARDDLARTRLRSLGFVFQQFNLIQGLTAVENVEVPLLLARSNKRELRERAMAALADVGLASHARRKPRQLSGGQQQRVAIARAIVTQPKVILCDEPTASLDRESGRVVLDLLRNLAADGERAVVVVTHDERVLTIADRVLEVADGRVFERGKPRLGGTS